MWRKFRWDMFVTSFIPLWVSILVMDIWTCIAVLVEKWDSKISIWKNIFSCIQSWILQVISIFIIVVMVVVSIIGIKTFIKDREIFKNNPKGKIVKATKANKLSSEFLLAYILPMIAFDFGNIKNISLFVIYFVVLAFLCIRNNNIYTNILLEFMGYKMYTCDIECSVMEKMHIYHDSLIISKIDLTQMESNTVTYWDFDNYIYITVNEENKK